MTIPFFRALRSRRRAGGTRLKPDAAVLKRLFLTNGLKFPPGRLWARQSEVNLSDQRFSVYREFYYK
jgi:hypothetical protein